MQLQESRLPSKAPDLRWTERGFSLVELLVALLLLAVALTTITALYLGHNRVQVRLGHQWGAQSYLAHRMEEIRRRAPLEEGRTETEFGEKVPAPAGLPRSGVVLIQEVEPWNGASEEERTQHVTLMLQWRWRNESRWARLESLVGGATP